MRTRLAWLFALVLAASLILAPAMPAFAGSPTFAQEEDTQSEDTGGEGVGQEEEVSDTEDEDGAGQSDPDAETGAGEGEQSGTSEEEGPVWTYQMAKIVIALLVLMALGIAAAYYKLVVQRQRAGI
jgi:hypothetical protein